MEHSRKTNNQLVTALFCTLMFFTDDVRAQRADENIITSAEDVFGTSLGGESIGLYTGSDVRGFSPVSAGNIRIEGLYFDQK